MPFERKRPLGSAGRPSKLTAEVLGKVEDALLVGATVDDACAYAGVSSPSYYRWLEMGETDEPSGIHRQFREMVARSPAAFRIRMLATVVKGATDGGKPELALRSLERYRAYKATDRLEVTGADGAALGVRVISLPESEDAVDGEGGEGDT